MIRVRKNSLNKINSTTTKWLLRKQFFNGVELLVEALSHRHSAGPETDRRGVHNPPRYVLSCRASAMLSDFDPSCVFTSDWYTL